MLEGNGLSGRPVQVQCSAKLLKSAYNLDAVEFGALQGRHMLVSVG